MEMTPETIRALLDAFDRSDWREMTVTIGTDRLHVSRDEPQLNGAVPPQAVPPPTAAEAQPQPEPVAAAAPTPAAASPAPAAADAVPAAAPAADAAAAPADGTVVEAPSVGLFWRAPSPGAPPFVEVGSRVTQGETLAIVEVMKLMNHVVAPVDGVVTAILAENGAPVEFGQAIVVIDPEG